MTEDFQFQPQNEPRSGTSPLLLVALGLVVVGAGAWYFLQQQPSGGPTSAPTASSAPTPGQPAQSPAVTTASDAVAAAPAPVTSTGGVLIPITSTATAQKEAVSAAGKDDPFRTAATKAVPVPITTKPVPKVTAVLPPQVPKEFFAKTIVVLGIVDTPRENYAILSYQGRSEIARVGDSIQSAVVKSISAQARTVIFREQGEEITRALEITQ